MRVYPLHTGWTLRSTGRADEVPPAAAEALRTGIPATVPGCVHDDLIAAGLLADPYLDRNEELAHWVGRTAWEYATAGLPAVPGDPERIDLVCHGLDTVAEVSVGGRTLGATANMHRTYRFDVTQDLTAATTGEAGTALTIRFDPVWDAAGRMVQQVGNRVNMVPRSVHHLVRKMACNFGWDWGPMVVTAGIWRPIELQAWSTARLASVRVHPSVVGGAGRLDVDLQVKRSDRGQEVPLLARVRIGDVGASVELAPGTDAARLTVTVPQVRIWQPHTRGGQPLYDVEIGLDAAGVELDRADRRVGFRTVELVTDADEAGSAFRFRVNGVDEYIRGFNWIPDDPLVSRVDAPRYRERLTQAVGAGANLVRVWGGGIYEDDAFYDACDELGLLVWQDFLFACAQYPEEEPLWTQVAAEARDNVVRLMHHPSLAVWNGNNENLWGWHVWGWEQLRVGQPRSWGRRYYLDLLPGICAELDPGRPYWPGSPWSGREDLHPNDPGHGCNHSWEVWNARDYTAYYDDVPRFVTEFGFQGPPSWRTLTAAVHDDPMTPTSPGVLHHQKAEAGDAKLREGMRPFFGAAADTEDLDLWHYLTQVNQARAVTTAISHWRSHWPHNAGAVLWQLNDCWPVTSWAALDMDLHGRARPKPVYFALQRLFGPQLLTIQQARHRRGADPDAPGLVAVAVNNGDAAWSGTLLARRITVDGQVLAQWSTDAEVAAGAAATIALPAAVAEPDDAGGELVSVELGGLRDLHFFVPDVAIGYPDPGLQLHAEPDGAGTRLQIRATALARDLLVQTDRLAADAQAVGLVTLLPGESTSVRVPGRWTAAQALEHPVLQHIAGALDRAAGGR